jgi:SpoVK/Ycf46/Vps4 family AAA+-type ATPase
VDVANIVSKWIGETEKNLGAIFDVAERTQAVLFLDEADALFGSRTKVSDAHDRYANLETAYLLQRLDRFQGLAVLATNLRQNIDPAFTRRMDFLVEFELPDLEGRHALWWIHLPGPLHGEDVDLASLASRYAVPGGWIRNAAIAAAYLAARGGGLVTQAHLLTALRREYAKDSRTMPIDPLGARHSAGRLAAPDERAIEAIAATSKEST